MHIDLVIAGGGVIGLSLAYELQKSFPALEFALFEKEAFIGEGASSRNSGVLHGGLYYPTGSLKHQFCLEGNRLWPELCENLNIPYQKCGKFVIASCQEEVAGLNSLFAQAQKNKVDGLGWCTEAELEEIAPFVHVKQAFFSSTTGVIDLSSALKALEHKVTQKGVPLLYKNQISELGWDGEKYRIQTERESFTTSLFVNACGAHAVNLRQQLELGELTNFWVKGNYLKLNKNFYNKSLLYPVPPQSLKGLGVHTSFDMDGVVRFGPNTEDVLDYNHNLSENLIDQMYPAINKVFKGIKADDLSPDYCGIRSKIKYKNRLYPDFWVKSGEELGSLRGYLEFCGIESPGFTSAPALALLGKRYIQKFFNL